MQFAVLLLCVCTAVATRVSSVQVGAHRPEQVKNRPSLIDYKPVANTSAVVMASDKMARFTVLTPRLIRMEYAKSPGVFEDRATIAMMNRDLPVPAFTHKLVSGALTIQTSQVVLSYAVGRPFSPSSLNVTSLDASSGFKVWKFGDASPGNLLGTIRGLDGQGNTPLNCTENKNILDNGEYNHCEWGVVSRDGWVIYDDTRNFVLDKDDWWVPNGAPPPPRACSAGKKDTDVDGSTRSSKYPDGTTADSEGECCQKCLDAADCVAWVYEPDSTKMCYPLAGWDGSKHTLDRTFGIVQNQTVASQQNADAHDMYGFFHGLDYFGALQDFVSVSGKTIMVPKYASGIWWSRWYDLNNLDLVKVTDDYGSRSIPLDVFVIDMDWHTKDNWSGFTFDPNLFPYPADSMDYLHALDIPVTCNIHDASGVNNWEAKFDELRSYLGLPADAKKVPFNILNATVAYAVEDIVLGDLLYNKHVDFWWIDWQQGGSQGGMTGDKQNPTIWLNHLRCTDRHRIGDDNRALVLARWGGMGGHRYQVGFSGDVDKLTWQNLAYQPYFSATAANVAHGFWSHDIEGPGDNMEMYTRWIQVGAFSGTMRSHDRGMSAGGCANKDKFDCSIVEPWNTPNVNFPDAYMEANRQALQFRAHLLPVVYNGHRSAFETGVGVVRPMYYHYPKLDDAYGMDANGNNVQYMFGPSILFSPVVQAGDASMKAMGPGLASKRTWLPPGTWVDANTGVVSKVTGKGTFVTHQYTLAQVPLWYEGGAIIPYVPLRSLKTSIGNAARQYTFLGFKIIPEGTSGTVSVYEDDGKTTAYLTDNAFAHTTATYHASGNTMTVSIATKGTFSALPKTRAYQLRLLNSRAVASVVAGGKVVKYNRWGKTVSVSSPPPESQHYYDFSFLPEGMGTVIDLIDVDTTSSLEVVITFHPDTVDMSGVYGAVTHAIWAKGNVDIERSTPGSNHIEPAPASVLSSTGQALEYLAGANATEFVNTVAGVPALLQAAITSLDNMKSVRKAYSVALLKNAE